MPLKQEPLDSPFGGKSLAGDVIKGIAQRGKTAIVHRRVRRSRHRDRAGAGRRRRAGDHAGALARQGRARGGGPAQGDGQCGHRSPADGPRGLSHRARLRRPVPVRAQAAAYPDQQCRHHGWAGASHRRQHRIPVRHQPSGPHAAHLQTRAGAVESRRRARGGAVVDRPSPRAGEFRRSEFRKASVRQVGSLRSVEDGQFAFRRRVQPAHGSRAASRRSPSIPAAS